MFDSGSVGELDIRALLWQYSGRTLADDLSKEWRGGAYMAFEKKSAGAVSTADLKLFYVSRWNSDLAAQRFAKFYASAVTRRYQSATPGAAAACVGADCPIASFQFATDEGPVVIELWKNNTVVISEGFDNETAAKLSAATRESRHHAASVAIPQRELGMRFCHVAAFRAFQERIGRELLEQVGLQESSN